MLKVAKLGIAIAAVAALIVPAAYAGAPDTNESFFVPEAVVSGVTVNAASAGGVPSNSGNAQYYLRTCPNNHSGGGQFIVQFLGNSARIRVEIRDQLGNGIPNVNAADICVLLNGRTAAQGGAGAGADSVVATSSLPSTALCPNITCMQADGPSDANGTAYITFGGATPGSPGVLTRDPLRKWGHFDSVLPVFVLGYQIQGRTENGAANGSYVLRIKNLDWAGGLAAGDNFAELVASEDVNQYIARDPLKWWWSDFDNSGLELTDPYFDNEDFNAITGHQPHSCSNPFGS